MSFIKKLNDNLANIDEYLCKYQKVIDNNADFFNWQDKKLEFMCKNLPYVMLQFKSVDAELKTMGDFLEFRRETLEGELWKKYIEGSKRHMAPKDIQMYSKQDPDFIMIQEFILEIAHMKKQITACIEALELLHWQLNNVTKIRVAALEEVVL
jgi:hypothetical protein